MAQEAPSVHVVLGLVAAGVGVSVMPAAALDAHPSGIAFVPVEDALEFDLLGIVAEGESSERGFAFLEVARNASLVSRPTTRGGSSPAPR